MAGCNLSAIVIFTSHCKPHTKASTMVASQNCFWFFFKSEHGTQASIVQGE